MGLLARRDTKAESSSSSYGLFVHLLMLSTYTRREAVSFGYGSQAGRRQGLAPCWFSTLEIAQPPAEAGGMTHSITCS
jgi:hypothetical protein